MANNKQLTPNLSMEELDLVVQRCISEEYTLIVVVGTSKDNPIHVSLEKGSSYGAMHMKFSANGNTVNEAFNKAYANFPANPVGARWDTKRIAAPTVEDGEFTEVVTPPPQRTGGFDDDIPF